MNTKERFYAVVGGCVGAVLTMAVWSLSPPGAQSQSDVNFGKITCSRLEVVRPDGTQAALIFVDEDGGGRVSVIGKDQTSLGSLFVDEGGGGVILAGKDGGVYVNISEHGGRVDVRGKDKVPKAFIEVGEDGGTVSVYDNDYGDYGKASASMSATPFGGHVYVTSNTGKADASMGAMSYTGIVDVTGNDGRSKSLTIIGVR